jgi:octaprenyl-diphosphate synthase
MKATELNFQTITEHYREELNLVEKELLNLFRSDVPLLPSIGKYTVTGGGKRIRPLFLLISSEIADFRGPERIKLAAIIESIHTASLLHDDVIDNARLRRGKTAAHHIWGNQIVILVGDYLYSNALKEAVSFRNQEIMEALSMATTAMTEGELLQLNKIGDPDITEEDYLKIVSQKTGALISSACRIGGILGNLSEEKKEALSRFGLKVGIAFQVSDDILDYISSEEGFGKNLGKDLEEGKITLPLIYLIKRADKSILRKIHSILKEGPQDGDLRWLQERLREYSSIESALNKAKAIVEEAKRELSIFEDSVGLQELLFLSDYAVMRRL